MLSQNSPDTIRRQSTNRLAGRAQAKANQSLNTSIGFNEKMSENSTNQFKLDS